MARTTIGGFVKVDEESMFPALKETAEKLESGYGEMVLDFSSLHRIDCGAVRAMEEFADTADGRGVKVVLRSVNVEVYKVLKLARLTPRFSFTA